jgi:hypothetical protein
MSKVTVKVEIPESSPDDLLDMALRLESNHTKKGVDSPLKVIDMTTFSAKLLSAKEKRAEAKRLHEEAEALNQQALQDLGIAKGQNSKTPGTIYNLITSARDVLMGINRGQEEKLNEWGFKVVSNSSATNVKSKSSATK